MYVDDIDRACVVAERFRYLYRQVERLCEERAQLQETLSKATIATDKEEKTALVAVDIVEDANRCVWRAREETAELSVVSISDDSLLV